MPGVRDGVCGEPTVKPRPVSLQRYISRRRWAVIWAVLLIIGGTADQIIGIRLWRLAPLAAGFRTAGVERVWREALRHTLVGTALVLVGIGAAAVAAASNRRIRCVRAGGCIKCGYSLTGLTEPRCPECGQPFEPKGDAT